MSDSRSDIEVPPTGLLPENPEEGQVPANREKTRRELDMEAIYERRRLQMEAELSGKIIRDGEEIDGGGQERLPENELGGPIEPDEEPQEPLEPRRRAEREPEEPTPQERAQTPVGPQLYPVQLADGQYVHVTLDQMARLANLGAVANQALHSYQNQVQPPSRPDPVPEPDPDFESVAAKVQYGNQADAAAALKSLWEAGRKSFAQPQLDPIAIANYATQQARKEAQLIADGAVIRQEFADIFENPIRSKAAADIVPQLRQRNIAAGYQQSDLETYREAGHMVRQAFGLAPPPAPPADPGQIRVQRDTQIDQRKRDSPKRQSQVIDRRAPAPESQRAPSKSDIVEWMRRTRHQPPMK